MVESKEAENANEYQDQIPLRVDISVFEPFKQKKIQNLFSNDRGSFIACEDTSVPAFKDWDHIRLSEWFAKIKMLKYEKTILYRKITGDQILQADMEWYVDELGMDYEDEMVHINTEINKVRFVTYQNPVIWVWGFNQSFQLGVSTGTKNISTPYKFGLN